MVRDEMAASQQVKRLAIQDAVTIFEDNGMPGKRLTAHLVRSLEGLDDYAFAATLVDRLEYMIDLHHCAQGGDQAQEEEEEEAEEPEPEPEPKPVKPRPKRKSKPAPTPAPEAEAEVAAPVQSVPEQRAQLPIRKKTVEDLLAEAQV